MKIKISPASIAVIFAFLAVLIIPRQHAQASPSRVTPLKISEKEEKAVEAGAGTSWLKDFDKARDNFAETYGTSFGFLLNYDQQLIIHSKHDEGKSRGLWYWNLDIGQALWQGASLFIELEVDKNRGVDKFLSTFSEFNLNSGANVSLYIPELYLEQLFANDKIYLAGGKLDLSDWFDDNEVAGSADTQFESNALVGSITIPFPRKGIGAMARIVPSDWLYFQSGVATVKSASTKIGFSDAFNSEFFITELGLSQKFAGHLGNYRFISYLTHCRLERINDEGTKDNNVGFALSFDQAVTGRISLFLRYGVADPKVNEIAYCWSLGGQISEPIAGRTFDCLGIGVAQSIMGKEYRAQNDPDAAYAETMYEIYYSLRLNELITLTPNIQVVTNPDANKANGTEVVGGVRFLLCF